MAGVRSTNSVVYPLSTTYTIILMVIALQENLYSRSTPDTGEASSVHSVRRRGFCVIYRRQGCWQKAGEEALTRGLLIFLLVENLESWEMLIKAARSLPLALEALTSPIPSSDSSPPKYLAKSHLLNFFGPGLCWTEAVVLVLNHCLALWGGGKGPNVECTPWALALED